MATKKESKSEFEISICKDGTKVIKSGNKIRRLKWDKEGMYIVLKGDIK